MSLDPKSVLFERIGAEIVFVGTPASCTEGIQRYVEAGVTQFNLHASRCCRK